MIDVHFSGDGPLFVSETDIKPHTMKPTKLAASDMDDAVSLTGLSWPREEVWIQTNAKDEEAQSE